MMICLIIYLYFYVKYFWYDLGNTCCCDLGNGFDTGFGDGFCYECNNDLIWLWQWFVCFVMCLVMIVVMSLGNACVGNNVGNNYYDNGSQHFVIFLI